MGTLPTNIVQLRTNHPKLIGRAGEVTIDWCNQCLVIHDGVTPGGCFTVCKLNLCEEMDEFPELGPLTNVNTAETLCDLMVGAPTLGVLEN